MWPNPLLNLVVRQAAMMIIGCLFIDSYEEALFLYPPP